MKIATSMLCMILVTAACADEHPLIKSGAEVKMLAEGFVLTERNLFFRDCYARTTANSCPTDDLSYQGNS